MRILETTLPISLEYIKEYFSDENIQFLIQYDESTLKSDKALIYLSNLELPCDINFDPNNEEHLDLLKCYMNCNYIVNIPSLEKAFLQVLLEYKKTGWICDSNFTYLKFIEENLKEIEKINTVIESLILYNFYTIESVKFKEFVDQFEKIDKANIGINFINLLKYEEFNLLFENYEIEKMKFYRDIFEDYMFKGKNLFAYWSNENNPLFLMTFGICKGIFPEKLEN